MVRIAPELFVFPDSGIPPKQFSGYVAIGYAGGSWHAGADTESSRDAFETMARNAASALRLKSGALVDAIAEIHPHTVAVFRVEQDEMPSVEILPEVES